MSKNANKQKIQNDEKIKVAFFGTSDRSLPILDSLNKNFNLAMCITKKDVLVGRRQTPKETKVKSWAKENGVKFVLIEKSLSKEADYISEQIILSGAKVGVVADFGYIIPQKILDIFPKGLINIHFSLLPKYRGASPVQFAILNQDKKTGITFQKMVYELDKGPIIFQKAYKLNGNETSGELYKKLFEEAAKILPNVLLNYINNHITPKEQKENKASYTYSPTHPQSTYIFKEDALINWELPTPRIEAAIRAFNPWPVAWCKIQDMEIHKNKIYGFTRIKNPKALQKIVKIYDAKLIYQHNKNPQNQTTTKNNQIKYKNPHNNKKIQSNQENNQQCQLQINKIQVEGGKILTWEEFKNGYLL